ncbi:NAD-dependent epimerase/dehydratase family protein [Mangrovibacterium lignilyticum]|uniref:NAD-dependent epimerase/dehydratase family protein n=1 Tax=Mangrovibacterium lignilyticum TaxID=2668052 RepID=UPI0013D57479|nr:NAD-dependent epimerase/dehydratase family protein [Mangrovibacterium lignilyticum]
MKVAVTGASGLVGSQLVKALTAQGYRVNALVRRQGKTPELKHPMVKEVVGNLSDQLALDRLVEGCEVVYHLAACAKMWAKEDDLFYRVNVLGTYNLVSAAKDGGVKKFVYTSTAGKYGPSLAQVITEETSRSVDYLTEYEKTKDEAEHVVREAACDGFEVFILNPTRVFGPGLLSESNGVTRMVKMYVEGRFRFIPCNGKSIGNYVFIDDVIAGHLMVLERGQSGENYILGGENCSFNEFFDLLNRLTEIRIRMIHLPYVFLWLIASFFEMVTKVTSRPPLITKKWLKRFLYNWEVSSQKAHRTLGYTITPLDVGLQKTIARLDQCRVVQ